MKRFTADLRVEEGKHIVTLAGFLNETSALPAIRDAAIVVVDMQGLSYINSSGIMNWLKWVSSAKETTHFVFARCAQPLVTTINMVKGFLPKNGSVDSFYVPYVNEQGTEYNVLIRSTDIDLEAPRPSIGDRISRADAIYELDVDWKSYTAFLRRKP